MCKYELRSVDRQIATNVPNVFFQIQEGSDEKCDGKEIIIDA